LCLSRQHGKKTQKSDKPQRKLHFHVLQYTRPMKLCQVAGVSSSFFFKK